MSAGSSRLKKSDRTLLEGPKTSTFVEAKNQHTIRVLGTNVKQTTSTQVRLMANLGTRTPLPASGVHEHTCDKCGSKYQHQHGGFYSQHAQNENQCPNPTCTWFHKGNNTTKAVPVGDTVEPKSATGQIPRRKDDTRSSTGSLYVEAEMQLHKRLREQISHWAKNKNFDMSYGKLNTSTSTIENTVICLKSNSYLLAEYGTVEPKLRELIFDKSRVRGEVVHMRDDRDFKLLGVMKEKFAKGRVMKRLKRFTCTCGSIYEKKQEKPSCALSCNGYGVVSKSDTRL